MRTSCVLFGPWLAVVGATTPLDLGNWMGQLAPVLGDATLLDLSVPGTHDSMTSDLSDDISEGYEGMGAVVSKILHTVTPVIAGRFIRCMGQTQGLDIVGQLDSGVRFIDFRIMYSDAPNSLLPSKDWYCLHGCQTRHKSLYFLQQARKWLDEHPKEIIVFWVSRHGGSDPTGTAQYPNTTPAERQVFFNSVVETFGSLLFNSSTSRLNETSIATMWERGQRVVWYAADYVESTNSSPLAIDARQVDNQCPGAGMQLDSLKLFRQGAAMRAQDKAQNRFFLMSLSNSGDQCMIEPAAFLTFDPFVNRKATTEKCAKCYGVPGMDAWCPMSLQDYGQMTNYYNQKILEAMYTEGASLSSTDFPNAIYLGGMDVGGRIHTGVARVNPLCNLGTPPKTDHDDDGYAYAATVVGVTLRRLCRNAAGSVLAACQSLSEVVEAARATYPITLWNDTLHGRLPNWPVIPPPVEQLVV